MALIKLPREVLEAIFTDVEIVDLASLRGTCGLFNKIIKGNKLLFKKIYLINLVRQVFFILWLGARWKKGEEGIGECAFPYKDPVRGSYY
jgi:hypothetical protein